MPGIQSQQDLTELIGRYREATATQDNSEERVQEVVDALDKALEETQTSAAMYGKGVRQLQSWCSENPGRLPSSCELGADIVIRDTPDKPYSYSGSSTIYTGRLSQSGTLVAIKVCHVEDNAQETQKTQQSLRNEVVTWKCLRHPNIVPFLGIHKNIPLSIISEWMPNGTISSFFAVNPKEHRSPYIRQIIRGLEFMHASGIVHGDLKPVNILVDNDKNARLVDFGMAPFLFKTSTQRANPDPERDPVGGTVRYMAPELLSEECEGEMLNVKTDIYALAITLWQFFAQKMPYHDMPKDITVVLKVLRKHRPSRPLASTDIGFTEKVWKIMQRGWAHEPQHRPMLVDFLQALAPDMRKTTQSGLAAASRSHTEVTATRQSHHHREDGLQRVDQQWHEHWPVGAADAVPQAEVLGAEATAREAEESPRPALRRVCLIMPELSEALMIDLREQFRLAIDANHGERVQNAIDALDQALGDAPPSGHLYGQGVRHLRTWCRTSGRLPSRCTLTDAIELTATRPFSQSALSDVYQGRARLTHVAVKVIREHANNQEAVRKSFRNEVVIWRHLRHPNIVPFLGISDLFPICVVSEWMSGGTISEFFLAHPKMNRSKHIQQIFRGLEFMHSLGVIHGDLKPVNILVDDHHNARLVDFGMTAVMLSSSTQAFTMTRGSVGGTVRYMAPELHNDDSKLTVPSDVYALAITLWELFSGQTPFPSIRGPEFRIVLHVRAGGRPSNPIASPDIGFTDSVWSVMERGWAAEPDHRPPLADFCNAVAQETSLADKGKGNQREEIADTVWQAEAPSQKRTPPDAASGGRQPAENHGQTQVAEGDMPHRQREQTAAVAGTTLGGQHVPCGSTSGAALSLPNLATGAADAAAGQPKRAPNGRQTTPDRRQTLVDLAPATVVESGMTRRPREETASAASQPSEGLTPNKEYPPPDAALDRGQPAPNLDRTRNAEAEKSNHQHPETATARAGRQAEMPPSDKLEEGTSSPDGVLLSDKLAPQVTTGQQQPDVAQHPATKDPKEAGDTGKSATPEPSCIDTWCGWCCCCVAQ